MKNILGNIAKQITTLLIFIIFILPSTKGQGNVNLNNQYPKIRKDPIDQSKIIKSKSYESSLLQCGWFG